MFDLELLNKIKEIIHSKDSKDSIHELMAHYHPYDVAKILEQLDDQERQELYDLLDEETLADILSYADQDDAADYLQEMGYSQGASILNEMSPDDAADILAELDEDVDQNKYLDQMDSENADVINQLITYDENTAGSKMTTNFVKINSGVDVKEATKVLGYEAQDAEIIDPLFVCDDNNQLVGVLKLQDLIIARTPKTVDEVMNTSFIYGEVNEDIIDVTKKIKYYGLYALPILDNQKLVGIITMDDALDVAESSISEDYNKMAAVDTKDNESPIWKNILKRVPWLLGLLIISLLISNITAVFSEIIQKVTILWFFNTMILGMAGNVGTQNLAVTIRHLGRNELDGSKKTFRYFLREFVVVLIIAVLLGILSFGVISLFILITGYADQNQLIPVALVISSSLALSLCCTGILGSVIPVIMDKIHIDPAVACGPLITTINDILAMVIYFTIAGLVL